MKMTLLGTGTSHGIPCIACDCPVCRSKDRRDKRTRCSAFVVNKNADGSESHILVDCGPEFRVQAIKRRIKKIDALLLTHSHADHLHGLDDIRVFSHTVSSDHRTESDAGAETEGSGMAIYGNSSTLKDVRSRFSYVFKETQIGGGKPKLHLERSKILDVFSPPEFGDMKVTPIPMLHGTVKTTGWLFSVTGKDKKIRSIAYLTDCSRIKERSIKKILRNCGTLDHLVIDGLRKDPHETHFSFLQAMAVAEKLSPVHTWFIHICHLNSHVQIQEYIETHLKEFPVLEKIVKDGGSVAPGFDGLTIKTL